MVEKNLKELIDEKIERMNNAESIGCTIPLPKKKKVSVFEHLNEKYGKEEIRKRIVSSTETPKGEFYRFEQDEKIVIKQHPEAIYSPTSFKYSNDGWGFVGNIQRYEELQACEQTGEAALIYPFGLNESQLWVLIGQIKGTFPKWSSEIDEHLEILDGLLIDVCVSPFDVTLPNGTKEQRKKIRLNIVKSGEGIEGYKNRLEWLRNKLRNEISGVSPNTASVPSAHQLEF